MIIRASLLSLLEEVSRISQVPRVPFRAFALLLDPGRISAPSLLRRFDSAPAVRTTKAPTLNVISRLSHTSFAPLHTLRAAISDDYATFASGRWLAFAGWGFVFPTGSLYCVSESCFLSDYMLFLTFWVFLTRPVLLYSCTPELLNSCTPVLLSSSPSRLLTCGLSAKRVVKRRF